MDHIEPGRWDALRTVEFPVTRKWAYLDHAALAPLPTRRLTRFAPWVDEQADDGVVGWPDRDRRLENIRGQVARLIHADRDEVAFVSSTTHGIGLIAEGFPWRTGDNVVTAAEEYPSNLYPWMNLESRGVGLRLVPTRDGRVWIDDLIAAVDRSTRLITISHVEFSSGFRNDLDAIGAVLPGARDRVVRRRDPGPRSSRDRRRENADRLHGGRRPQVATRPRGSGALVRAPRMDRAAAADRRRLAERRRLIQPAGRQFSPQAGGRPLGGGHAEHGRTACVRGECRPHPRNRAGRRLTAGTRAGERRARGCGIGRMDGSWLAVARRSIGDRGARATRRRSRKKSTRLTARRRRRLVPPGQAACQPSFL